MNVKKKHGCKKDAIREELNPLSRLTLPLFSERFIDPVFLPQPVSFVFPSIFQCAGVCLRGGLVVFGVVPGMAALVSPGTDYQKWRPLFSPSTHCSRY